MISDVAAEGNAIAKVDGMVVFLPYGAPGDVVDIQLVKKKKNYAEGKITCLYEYSPCRVEPQCAHFGLCGGCRWRHLAYSEQLRLKNRQVVDCMERIACVKPAEARPILPSERTDCYRNKLEFTFSDRRWLTAGEMTSAEMDAASMSALGFHIPGRFDKVLDIETCLLQDDISNRIRRSVKAFCIDRGLGFANLRSHEGLMRNLVIRNSASTGQVMVIAVFGYDDAGPRSLLLNHLSSEFPEITSLMYVVNTKCNDSLSGLEARLFAGSDHIVETMGSLQFRIGPMSFYQTNSRQAARLYEAAAQMASLRGNECVYDLYTGAGTIANFIASRAAKVVGIEYVDDAVRDARANVELNGITNAEFFAGDMKDVLVESFIRRAGRPDVVITDPPRAGMHESVVKAILSAMPSRVVYVSCNPATQARDIALMAERYSLAAIQPVDMFPHTHHVENIALLVKND